MESKGLLSKLPVILAASKLTKSTTGLSWSIKFNFGTVEVNTRDLLSQSRFRNRCVTLHSVLLPIVSTAEWNSYISDILIGAGEVEVPNAAGQMENP